MPAPDPKNSATRDADSYFQAALNATATRTYRTAVRFHLSDEDRDDLHQELLLDLLEHASKFDQSKGSAGTFTGVVSEHRTADYLNDLKRDRSRLVFCALDDAANDPDIAIGAVRFTENGVPLWADDQDHFSDRDALQDLETALGFMTAEQRTLFSLLVEHQDLPTACRVSGLSTATFYRRVADLQMHLRMFGFASSAGTAHVTLLRKISRSPGNNNQTPQISRCGQLMETV